MPRYGSGNIATFQLLDSMTVAIDRHIALHCPEDTPVGLEAESAVRLEMQRSCPIIPFFFMSGLPAIIVAAITSLIAHFAVGAAKSLIPISAALL